MIEPTGRAGRTALLLLAIFAAHDADAQGRGAAAAPLDRLAYSTFALGNWDLR